ncbi:hypothetical protein QR680_016517 [Steinernema hermaphroditum]|uniref:separase n=1 Tax=Steinernema hermaphroditum TaxID=289476 RepID=A0AA39LM42_9BILA|nr:hypothetical protein QR680_016517 [Steinernema hermaphroditum]
MAQNDEKLTRHIEYCTKLMYRCSYHLNDVQIAVNTRWKELLATNFDFLLDIDMKRHMEIVDALTGAYGKYRGTHYLESVYKVWYGGLSAYIRNSATTMTPYIRASLINVGTILAALLVLHAEYHRAIVCLHDVITMDAKKSSLRLAILRVAAEAGEWDILRELLLSEDTLPALSDTVVLRHEPFVKLYRLMLRMRSSNETVSSEEIGRETTAFHTSSQVDFTHYEGAALEHEIRAMASRLPNADLRYIGDPVDNRRRLIERVHVLQKSRLRTFFAFGEPSGVLKKLTVGEEMLKLACVTSRLYESLRQMTNEAISTGLLKEAQANVMQYLCYALRTCIPIHVLRAMTQVLRSLEYTDKQSSRYEEVARAFKKLLSSLEPQEMRTSTIDVDLSFAKVVQGYYEQRCFEEFCTSWDRLSLVLRDENRRVRKKFFDPSGAVLDLCWLQAEPYVDVICRYTSGQNGQLATSLRRKALKQVEQLHVELRPYWLLLKLALERKNTFDEFSHLLLREWRPKMCSHLARSRTQPSERAFYLSEAVLCGVRQTARAYHASKEETYSYSTVAEFMADVTKLPKDLTVIQLFIDDANTLWFSRLHSSLEPFTVPLFNLKEDDTLARIEAVLAESIKSTEIKESVAFWRTRKRLDKRLKDIVLSVEDKWFGPILPFLLPYSDEVPPELVASLTKRKMPEELAKSLLCAAALAESRNCWLDLVKFVCNNSNVSYRAIKTAVAGSYDNFTEEDREAVRRCVKNKFTIFNLPAALSCIPFESMPFFSEYPLVCRIPSFKLFCNLIRTTAEVPKPVNCRSSFYILNPGGDLQDTEKRVRDIIESYEFDGIRGQAPTSEMIKEVLGKYDVLLYIGHGSGGRYFSRRAVRTSECKAVSILMGCASVGIESAVHNFDGRSAVYDYMMARCPCVIGCMWMVTDGEIDKYLVALLKYCFSHLQTTSVDKVVDSVATEEGYRTFLRGIAEARKACRLPYLTGGSVVAYGLPIVSKIH